MAAAEREPLRETDLLAMSFVAEPDLSPDGSRVAFTRTTLDAKTNTYRSRIEAVPADGTGPVVPLTSGPGRDSQARHSPDGRYLAFLSDREADAPGGAEGTRLGTQLYVLPLGGGEARRVTGVLGGVEEPVWSPDATRLAFVARIRPGGAQHHPAGTPPAAAEDLDGLYAKYNRDVRHITRLQYRLDGAGWFEDRRAHVFVVDVAAALAADSDALPPPLQITSGPYDHHGPAWSPDGRTLAVSACRAPEADRARFSDLWLFPADGSAAGGPGFDAPRGGAMGGGPAEPAPPGAAASPTAPPLRVTPSDGYYGSAAFAPDARRLAFLGHTRPHSIYSDTRVWVVDLGEGANGAPRCLTEAHPRSFGDQSLSDARMGGRAAQPAWTPDGRHLLLLGSDRGTTHLYRVDSASGLVERLTSGDIVLFDACLRPESGRAALCVAAADHPGDVFAAELQPGCPPALEAMADPLRPGGLPLRRLTQANAELLSRRTVVVPERFRFRGEGGPEVDGWAWRPAGLQPGETCPAVLQIHGGPQLMYTGAFFLEFQVLLGRGMAVVCTNPRGSQGYGEDFCAGIEQGWGSRDYDDVQAGVDAALARFPWIDAQRLGIAGGSYGGYLSAWVIAHTDRFRAACVMRPVINAYSFFGSCDLGHRWQEVWGEDLPPWQNPAAYLRISPISHADRMRTPTLIIQSEQDHRCPPEQSEQLYTALRLRGVEVEYLRYPDEGHGLSRGGKPWHRVHRLRQIAAWFVEHL